MTSVKRYQHTNIVDDIIDFSHSNRISWAPAVLRSEASYSNYDNISEIFCSASVQVIQ